MLISRFVSVKGVVIRGNGRLLFVNHRFLANTQRLYCLGPCTKSGSGERPFDFPALSLLRYSSTEVWKMVEPKETQTSLADTNQKGAFERKTSQFRNMITADGSSGFKAERDRYHLYVSLACPWAHRTLIVRKLKGLEDVLPYTVVDWLMSDKGWNFTDKKPKCSLDPLFNASYVRDIYFNVKSDYDGRFTVPILFDKQKMTIVNNESSEIIRILNTEFNEFCATDEQRQLNFYPEALRSEIDDLNSWIYPCINNGVYRAGFARSQGAYDEAVKDVFSGLDRLEEILSKRRFLTGNTITEADIRLVTTLFRFDTVYVGHFKCNKKRIIDYPNIWGFTRDMYSTSGIAETVDQEHIQKHYQQSHRSINPFGIVAIGPDLDWNEPHGRECLSA